MQVLRRSSLALRPAVQLKTPQHHLLTVQLARVQVRLVSLMQALLTALPSHGPVICVRLQAWQLKLPGCARTAAGTLS